MTAKVGADGLDIFGDPRPELLVGVVRIRPEQNGEWADLEDRPGRPGFRSTQRLWISDVAGGIAVATWPAEKGTQSRYLYGRGLGSVLVTAALERGWTVEPSPHIAFYNSPPASRLYMRPAIAPLDYAALWEEKDALRRIRYPREDVERQLWPWLKRTGLADDRDDPELGRFLGEFLRMPKADMRPGLRFRRVWTSAEAAELAPGLAETIRSEFDAVFAAAHEPPLRTLEGAPSGPGRKTAPGAGAARREDGLAARLAGASGVQLGSGNVQYNYFNDNPAQAGSGGTWPAPAPGASGPSSRGHAFISYVREDSAEVDALQKTLEEAGIPVWRDTSSLWPGENWNSKIRTAINSNSLVFIACFSTHTAARQRSYQNEELLLAIDQVRQRRPDDPWLIPVRLDDCDVPDFDLGAGRTLASINRADLFGPNRDQATRRLVEAVRRLLR